MELGQWEKIVDPDQHEGLLNNVLRAQGLGQEGFSQIVLDASNDLLGADELWYMFQTLIVGNLAFEAKPEIKVEGEGFTIHLRIEVS